MAIACPDQQEVYSYYIYHTIYIQGAQLQFAAVIAFAHPAPLRVQRHLKTHSGCQLVAALLSIEFSLGFYWVFLWFSLVFSLDFPAAILLSIFTRFSLG